MGAECPPNVEGQNLYPNLREIARFPMASRPRPFARQPFEHCHRVDSRWLTMASRTRYNLENEKQGSAIRAHDRHRELLRRLGIRGRSQCHGSIPRSPRSERASGRIYCRVRRIAGLWAATGFRTPERTNPRILADYPVRLRSADVRGAAPGMGAELANCWFTHRR